MAIDLKVNFVHEESSGRYTVKSIESARASDQQFETNCENVSFRGKDHEMTFKGSSVLILNGNGMTSPKLQTGCVYNQDEWDYIIDRVKRSIKDIRNNEITTMVF